MSSPNPNTTPLPPSPRGGEPLAVGGVPCTTDDAENDVASAGAIDPHAQKVSEVAVATSHTFSASNAAVPTDSADASVEAVPTAVASVMSPDYFLAHWQEILPRYIGHGRPAFDTMVHYTSYINQFFDWCAAIHRHPMEVTDYEMRGFLEWLYGQGYKDDTIAVKLVAIRRFFAAAERLHIIAENPCQDIYVPNATPDELIHFFTPDQLYEICTFYGENEDAFLRERNISIVYLMGVEGMRNVEIHRMNREDIDMDVNSIFVRGKGHDRRIFPCEETMAHLRAYLAACPAKVAKDGAFTPMFLSASRGHKFGRLSRNGIRFIMDQSLIETGFKKPGVSCHAFRHSAGTNLYAATKDLRLVQDTLGHRDPKTTARYAHVQERMNNRRTAAIVPRPHDVKDK